MGWSARHLDASARRLLHFGECAEWRGERRGPLVGRGRRQAHPGRCHVSWGPRPERLEHSPCTKLTPGSMSSTRPCPSSSLLSSSPRSADSWRPQGRRDEVLHSFERRLDLDLRRERWDFATAEQKPHARRAVAHRKPSFTGRSFLHRATDHDVRRQDVEMIA